MAKIFSKDSITVMILVIVILLALGYSINSLFQGVKFDIGDSEAELAQKWLTQSTNSPESCRKLTANSEQWFDEFLKDRKSLGPLKTRFLKSKQQITKKKQHLIEIVFESSFANARRLDEVVTIKTDKNRERLVAGIDYRYRLTPRFTRGNEIEITPKIDYRKIIRLAEKCSASYDGRKLKYFNQVSINDCGYVNKRSAEIIKSRRAKTGRAKSRKRKKIIYRNGIPGISSLEQATVINRVTYMVKNHKRHGREIICLKKDNRLKNPQWQVYYYNIRLFRLK
jgi:hypothetical protein